jgi:hypothetical protein
MYIDMVAKSYFQYKIPLNLAGLKRFIIRLWLNLSSSLHPTLTRNHGIYPQQLGSPADLSVRLKGLNQPKILI